MEIPGQIIPVQLQGLDTKTDSKVVIPGKLLSLQNGVFTNPGRISKCFGNTNLRNITNGSVVTSIPAGNFTANYGSELLVGDGYSLWSYSPTQSRWTYKGRSVVAQVTSTSLARDIYSLGSPQLAISSTTKLVTWYDAPARSNYAQVVDAVTGDIIAGPVALNTSTTSGVGLSPTVNLNGTLTAFVVGTGGLRYVTWNGTQLVQGTLGITPAGYFDVSVNATSYIISYENTAATGITTQLISSAFALGASVTNTDIGADGQTNPISTTYNSTTGLTWVSGMHVSGGNYTAWMYSVNSTCTAINDAVVYSGIAGTNIVGTAVYSAAGVTYIYWSELGSASSDGHYPYSITHRNTYATIASNTVFIYGVQIASKPWTYTYAGLSLPTIMTWHDSNAQAGYYIVTEPVDQGTTLGVVIAKAATQFQAGSYGYPLPAPSLSGNLAVLPGTERYATQTGTSGLNLGLIGIKQFTFDFTYTNPNTVLLNANQIIGGGTVRAYDGVVVTECGFHLYPEYVGAGLTTGGGLFAGSYQWAVTYEWIDNQGQVHQSLPSETISYTASAGQSAIVVAPSLDLTDKTNVNVVLWRTAVNQTVFYRLNTGANINPSVPGTFIIYTDTQSDAAIAGNPQLYTTGEAGNIAPPPSVVMTSALNRTILIPSEQPTSWWYSKENPPGSPPEFSDEFVNNADPTGGPITAVAQMDSNLFFLKNTSIYYVAGTGPANSGAGSTYTDAALLPTSSGSTTNQVVLTSQGLMYQSEYGIWMLSRGLSDSYVGAPVEQYNSDPITSALLIPGTNQVRFLTAAGVALVYDYYASQWATFTIYSGVSAAIWMGNYSALTSSGSIQLETPNAYMANGVFYPLQMTTGWLEFAGLQGFQRVRKMYLLGDWLNDHGLNVSFAYDFGNATQTDVFAVPAALTPYQFRFFMNVQKCQAIQVSVTDTLLSTVGASYDITGIAFEVALKKGFTKNINPNQSFG